MNEIGAYQMIVTPKVRGFICTTAHPIGCEMNVKDQVNYVKNETMPQEGPKNVLIIGASTGYGLATRIVSMAGFQANTLGVFFEKEAKGKRTASAGWYNSAAVETIALQEGIYAKSINGDAFSDAIKDETIRTIREDMGTVDLVVYSLAAPRRIDPKTGEKYTSVLKPIGEPYTNKSIDVMEKTIEPATIEPATEEEIEATIKVMGGEDWALWIERLLEEGLLSNQAKTIAYSYIGPDVTRAIYREGTIGMAKKHLEQTASALESKMKGIEGNAKVVVAKALVTQASSAIPIVPLYIAALYKTMKEKGTHEGCIEQITRLFKDILYGDQDMIDDQGRIRIDNLEMESGIQKEALSVFDQVTTENIDEVIDIDHYREAFYELFGFGRHDLDYDQDVNIEVKIPSLS